MSQGDADYTEDWLRYYLPEGKKSLPIDKLGRQDFEEVFKASQVAIGVREGKEYGDNVENYQHHSMKRGADKRFSDHDLTDALLDAHARPAHSFGARSTPSVMRFTEIAGMVRPALNALIFSGLAHVAQIYARNVWKCCTLNECVFRSIR